MWQGYYRQRRRIAISMLMVFWALVMGFAAQADILTRIQEWLFGAGILGLVATFLFILCIAFLTMSAVVVFAPALRHQCEIVSASLLVMSVFVAAMAINGTGFVSPLLAVCTFVLLSILLDHLIYGRTLDWLGLWRPLSAQESFEVAATAHGAWNAVLPLPDTVHTHWIGALNEVVPTGEPDVYAAQYKLGDGTVLTKLLTYLTINHPRHARYHFETEDDGATPDARFGAGFCEAWFESLDDEHTRVTIACEFTALRLRVALGLWFDDWLGGEADAIQAYLENRPDRSLHGRLWRDVLRQA